MGYDLDLLNSIEFWLMSCFWLIVTVAIYIYLLYLLLVDCSPFMK